MVRYVNLVVEINERVKDINMDEDELRWIKIFNFSLFYSNLGNNI
jgi:hypothetical protein